MTDEELERRWRAHSSELPSPQLDGAIRAAARQAMRRRPAWQRYVPLAAAASVGVIAFLLVRQTPTPAPTAIVPALKEAREPTPEPVAAESTAPNIAAPAAAVTEDLVKHSRVVTQERAKRAVAAAPPAMASLSKAEAARAEAATDTAADGMPPVLAALVKADAARRAGISEDEVRIVSAESIMWSDGALGCRTPGEMATQVLTPGFRIDVDAAGTRLLYHTDTRRQIRVCARPDIAR